MFGGKNIEKSYGKNKVLHNVTFSLENNKIIGIFGLNGSGKTTLLRILSGLDGYFKGEIYKTDFEDVAYMSVDNITPPEMTVKGVIDFYATFLPKQDTSKILEELKEVGIKTRSHLKNLSSGMRQYVKFLLTLYSGASVCLFDEPLSNLDINLRNRIVQSMISELTEDRLFIITTHEIKEMERIIDGFYILKNGAFSEYYESEKVVEETGKSIEEFYKEKVNEKN